MAPNVFEVRSVSSKNEPSGVTAADLKQFVETNSFSKDVKKRVIKTTYFEATGLYVA
jgi:hypothetical protein